MSHSLIKCLVITFFDECTDNVIRTSMDGATTHNNLCAARMFASHSDRICYMMPLAVFVHKIGTSTIIPDIDVTKFSICNNWLYYENERINRRFKLRSVSINSVYDDELISYIDDKRANLAYLQSQPNITCMRALGAHHMMTKPYLCGMKFIDAEENNMRERVCELQAICATL